PAPAISTLSLRAALPISSIRSGEPSDTPTEDATMDLAADLRKLVDNSTHGVPTVLQTEISADLPPEVARSALRIVQEALTNIGKDRKSTRLNSSHVKSSY